MTDIASQRQIDAADPNASTWLSANAGSGKTRVLTDRVARLLLEGAPPQNILCLTYTKAAAGEMQNRLFKTLGAWAMMPDADLADTLAGIGAGTALPLGSARTLFARAIETPGGLKIQTIHSFCAALLRQFPLEAGVSPGFTEMDESAQRHLLADLLEMLAEEDRDGAVSGLARYHSGADLPRFTAEIAARRAAFATPPDRAGLLRAYGAPADLTPADLTLELDLDAGLIARLKSTLRNYGSSNDLKAFDRLTELELDNPGPADHAILEGLLLVGSGDNAFTSKRGKFPTKATRAMMAPEDLDALDALMDRVEALRPRRLALAAAERTLALHRFAAQLLPAYEAEKARRGWLDFDDLIARAATLLSDSAAADWVRFRLDGRIDHILVDESQDTSLSQWRVIQRLSEEFGTGEGAEGRTLFVVGDKKQSIYSFQGADLDVFEEMRARFSEQLGASGGMRERALLHSFRSAPAILRAVDATFHGGTGLGGAPTHIAFHEERPGRVDLWPLVEPQGKSEEAVWYDPVDLVSPDHPSRILSARIAAEISRMIADPTMLVVEDGKARRAHAGDMLILVKGRTGQGDLFQSLIRALKSEGLPVAGADLMRLDAELAVKDLRALLAFLALPEDDLSLAAALRSPLFGWSEDRLYRLAAGRGQRYLWRRLEDEAAEHADTHPILRDLRDQADFLRPYDLLERALVRHGGRRRLLARLGAECEDAIDEMLALALAYERQEVPSLTGFLAWLDGEAVEVKRPLDQSGHAVRVMTVHGAKGLEAPVVFLPDSMRPPDNKPKNIALDAEGGAHWLPAKPERPALLVAAREDLARREALERQRLLYVAMTRAETRLVVCGIGDGGKSDGTWYGDVRAGLVAAGAVPCAMPTGEDGLRLENGDWSAEIRDAATPETGPTADLPAWAEAKAPPPPPRTKPLAPSDLPGAKALGGEGRSEEEAKRHGRRVHLLLEHLGPLPPGRHAETAVALLAAGEDAAPEDEARALAAEVTALLARPELAGIFAPDALAEVPVTAAIPELGGARIRGVIDRLLIGPESVLIVDFKTNAVVPGSPAETPDGILRQMAAYASAVAQIYPDRRIETAILWTATGQLMVLPHEIVMASLPTPATS